MMVDCRQFGSHKILAMRDKYSVTLKCGVDWVSCWTHLTMMVWLVEKFEYVCECYVHCHVGINRGIEISYDWA